MSALKVITTLTRAFDPQSGVGANGQPWTRSDFEAANGMKFSTFKGDIASVAAALLNQTAEIEYTEKQNGQYTNRTLLGITPRPEFGGAQVTHSAPATALHSPPSTHTASSSISPDRELRIMRQSALDRALTAFGIEGLNPIQDSDALFQLADEFIDYFNNGRAV